MVINDRYELKSIVGNGGMSVTYDAFDRQLKKEVVIKLTNVEDTLGRTKAIRECDMLMNLNHDHIVRVYDRFVEDNKVYMIMEKIHGETLRDYASKYNVNEEQAINITIQLLLVLDYLHSQKPVIIYRDLSPDNVMINPVPGDVKLIDFGIARTYKEEKHQDTELLGTPGFAPKEQYGFDQTDNRSDIYSLGATIYYLITKKEPLTFPKKNKTLKNVKSNINNEFSDIIEKAMMSNKCDRYKDCKSFLQDVNSCLNNIRGIENIECEDVENVLDNEIEKEKFKEEVNEFAPVISKKLLVILLIVFIVMIVIGVLNL